MKLNFLQNMYQLNLSHTDTEHANIATYVIVRWHYSPLRSYDALLDFSQSALLLELSFQFVLCIY